MRNVTDTVKISGKRPIIKNLYVKKGNKGAARWSLAGLGVRYSLPQSLGLLVDIAFSIVLLVSLTLLALAAADFLFQRYDLLGQLRMTKQEVKDEHRQSEGDPAIKAQMARMRRSFLTRVMQAVPNADVVLVNPTHYAVAIKYDPTSSAAPMVLAKGTGLIAQRIREVAAEHRIPVISNPPPSTRESCSHLILGQLTNRCPAGTLERPPL